jgi:phosphoribosylformylglycinamidine synthase
MPDLEYYQKVHRLVQPGQVLACGVVGKGGLAVTLSKMLFGGDCGADVVIDDAAPPENILFNETAGCFVVEIPAGADVQTLLGDLPHQVLGKTTPAKDLTVRRRSSNEEVVKQSIDELKTAWKTPNEEIFA